MIPFPAFLRLTDRPALLVGGGPVAAGKLTSLLDAGARVTVVAPEVLPDLLKAGVQVLRRAFQPADLDGCWFAVAAATAPVNRQVAKEAEARRIFVNAVDDVRSGSAHLGGVVRRGGVTVAISTGGRAPALAKLLREAVESFLPDDLGRWTAEAERLRAGWREQAVPMAARRRLLLRALQKLYARTAA